MEEVFLTELEKEYTELIKTGKIKIVEDVKKLTSKQFSYENPLYFLGNIRSRTALIKFSSSKENLTIKNKPLDFITYQSVNQSLGEIFLQPDDEEEFENIYYEDIRMFNYLKPFQVLRFKNNSIKENLQKLTNEKLELELVPYLSPDFSEVDFMNNYKICKPFIERLLNGILSYPRQYIVFIGEGFKNILAEYIEDFETFNFFLTSPNYPNQKVLARFTRITLKYHNRKVIAGIAESYCDKNLDNIMIEKYGRESVAIINRGFLLSSPLWKEQ